MILMGRRKISTLVMEINIPKAVLWERIRTLGKKATATGRF